MDHSICAFAGLDMGSLGNLCWSVCPVDGPFPSGVRFINVDGVLPVIGQQMCRVDGNVALCVLPDGTNPSRRER